MLSSTEFQVGKMESSGDGGWEWLHDNRGGHNATKIVHLKLAEMVNCTIYIFQHNKKLLLV